MQHIIIIGAGFGGLQAAKRFDRQAVRVTILDRANHHLFQPLLYQVATAGLSAPAIAAPIRRILRNQRNVTVLLHDVIDIDTAGKRVLVRDGKPLFYDKLIVASGVTHSYFGQEQWAAHAPGLKTLSDAMDIRRRVLLDYEMAERDAIHAEQWLRFIVIGGGPTGVEMAGTLAEIARHALSREFRHIEPSRAQIVLIEASDRILSSYPEDLSKSALKQMESLGVKVMLGQRVTHIDETGVQVGQKFLASRTVIWAAGVQASPLAKSLGVPLDNVGRVKVNADLSVSGCSGVFVIGDLAYIENSGKPVPGVSPAAKQMGQLAASNILRQLDDSETVDFVYKDYGSMATIGRKRAIAHIGPIKLRGFVAWLSWLIVHIYFLIGFRNRFMVLVDWSWAYFTFNRSARVVWRESKSDSRDDPDVRNH